MLTVELKQWGGVRGAGWGGGVMTRLDCIYCRERERVSEREEQKQEKRRERESAREVIYVLER